MILAAGFGTRLGPLTRVRPKPMLPICGASLVRWSVLWLRAQGVREIVVNLHHLGDQIVQDLGDGSGLEVDIAYSNEAGSILGTGGGLRQARALLDDGHDSPIIVANGKILVDLDLGPALAAHRGAGREATMVMRDDAEGVWGGSLAPDADDPGVLATFLGETRPGATPGPKTMFTGIHIMQPRFLDRVPPSGEQCIVRTAYRELFRDSEQRVGVHLHPGYWWEHSTPERYLAGIRNVLDGRVDLPWAQRPVVGVDPHAVVDPSARIVDPVFIGPGARIGAFAVIGPHSQVGAGARVGAGVQIVRSAVWPGAEAHADLTDAVCVPDPRSRPEHPRV